MIHQKKKYWETPELIAARSEAVRLHKALKYTTVEIGNELGKSPTQIWRWLKAAQVFQPISPKEAGEKRRLMCAVQKAARIKRMQEIVALKARERLARLYICKECGTKFKPIIKFQGFCSQSCRTKSYLRLNREVLAEKAKKKSELLHKSRAQHLYVTKNPKCNFCHSPIPFSRFLKMSNVIYCSQKCSQKAQSEKRKNDPIAAAKYKITKKETYKKRQLNGKNRLEKREYLRNNPQARIAKNLRTRLYLAVKRQGGKKCDSTRSLTGADWPTFSAWIENKFKKDMTWDNYGIWHVDHIDSCKSFDLTKPEQQRECFHYTNLQPLWGSENIKKGAKIIPKQKVFIFDS
jgi:transposase-like protein